VSGGNWVARRKEVLHTNVQREYGGEKQRLGGEKGIVIGREWPSAHGKGDGVVGGPFRESSRCYQGCRSIFIRTGAGEGNSKPSPIISVLLHPSLPIKSPPPYPGGG